MRVKRQLPFAIIGTALVVVLPALVAALLPAGPLLTIPACVGLSLAISAAASALWRRLPQSCDILFSDLMLWGWLRRLRTERRLEHVETFVAGGRGPVEAIRSLRGLQRVTDMLESRDAYTRRHSHRVTRHCEGIARELGLDEDEMSQVRTAAALHDIGKFFTPREVLNKPGRLTAAEFAIVQRHPDDGADLVKGVVDDAVVDMIRHHHERLGGTGYPDRLTGDAIPLGARIIAVADTFDAMTSTRAYRIARPHANALRVLREEAGVALDAQVVDAFLAYYSGRRSARWSSLASAFPHLATPVRELALSGGRALPALGASAAILAAPAISDGTAATLSRSDRDHRAETRSSPAQADRVAALEALLARTPGGDGGVTRIERGRGRTSAPQARHRPGVGTTGGGAHGNGDGNDAPAPEGSTPGSSSAGSGSPSGSGTPSSGGAGGSPDPTPSATAAPTTPAGTPVAQSPAPPAASPPPSEPEVQVEPVTVQAGEVEVQTPVIEIDLPDPPVDLPVKLPPIHIGLP